MDLSSVGKRIETSKNKINRSRYLSVNVLNTDTFQIELEFRNVGFCGEGKIGVPVSLFLSVNGFCTEH